MNDHLSRRSFLQRSGLVGAGITAAQFLPLRFLQAQPAVDGVLNPLAHYPNRNWEQQYRNQYAYDQQFSWVCAPNDTHNCRITAHVRNNVIVRMGEQYDVGTYADLYGNKATEFRDAGDNFDVFVRLPARERMTEINQQREALQIKVRERERAASASTARCWPGTW